MKLHYKAYGDSSHKCILILHGLFGLGDNWVSIARKLAQTYYVVVPDHRNHGMSPHSDDFSLQKMSEDLGYLIEDLSLNQPLLLGHSMGGKVAMHFTLHNPDLVSGLIVADISTKESYVRPEHKEIVNQFMALDLSKFQNLQNLQSYLLNEMPNPKLAFMVLKNIRREGDKLSWKLNTLGITQNLESVLSALDIDDSYMNAVLFIRGGASDYIQDEDIAELQSNFPYAEVKTIDGASHWLHADNPELFYSYVIDYTKLIRFE